MPPKVAEPDGPTAEELIERQEAITDTIDLILSRVDSFIDESEFRRVLVRNVVSGAVRDTMDVVELALLAREETALNIEVLQTVGSSWVQDEEVPCPPIDTWARGVLPFKRRPLPPPTPTESLGGRSRRSDASSFATNRKGGRGAPSAVGDDERSQRESQRMTSNQQQPATRAAVPSTLVRPKKKVSPQEAAIEERLREEIEVRQQQKEAARQQKLKDEEDRQALELLQKDLRGADYVYNHKGEVVALAKLDPDKLPPSSVAALTTLAPLISEEELAEMEREKKAKASMTSSSKKKKEPPKKKVSVFGGEPATPFFPDDTKRQVSLLDTMTLEGGVTLREGNSSKAGPKREGRDPASMTRAEYLASIGSSDVLLDGDEVESRAGSSRAGSRARTPGTPEVTGAAAAAAAARAGGGRVGGGGEYAEGHTEAMSTLLEATDVKPLVDVNETLTKAPDWGQNPPARDYHPASYPSDKVTVRERELTLGRIPRFPRERPFIAHKTEHELGLTTPPLSPTASSAAGGLSPGFVHPAAVSSP